VTYLILLLRLGSAGASKAQRVAVLVAAALVLFCPRAFAAAPLCDPSAASIAAPIPALPNATGELTAPPSCDDNGRGAFSAPRSERDAPALDRLTDVPDRVAAAAFALPALKGALVPRPGPERGPVLPGYSIPVYRPPRS
jgi:hypothetical protein